MIGKRIPFVSFVLGIINVILSLVFSELNVCVYNKGIAFGISVGYEYIFSVLILIVILILTIINKSILRYFLLSFFFLGLSNLVVRILYGSICDYISLLNMNVNIADISIVALCVLTLIYIVLIKGDENV